MRHRPSLCCHCFRKKNDRSVQTLKYDTNKHLPQHRCYVFGGAPLVSTTGLQESVLISQIWEKWVMVTYDSATLTEWNYSRQKQHVHIARITMSTVSTQVIISSLNATIFKSRVSLLTRRLLQPLCAVKSEVGRSTERSTWERKEELRTAKYSRNLFWTACQSYRSKRVFHLMLLCLTSRRQHMSNLCCISTGQISIHLRGCGRATSEFSFDSKTR